MARTSATSNATRRTTVSDTGPSPRNDLPAVSELERVAGPAQGEMRHTAMAAKLGVHPRTLRRQFLRGGLPGAKEHGERILVVPTRLFRLAQAYGLRGVERMATSGLL